MSWDQWTDSVVQQSGNSTDTVVIAGRDGSIWSVNNKPGNPSVVATDTQNIANVLLSPPQREESFTKGVYVQGRRYRVVSVEDGELRAAFKLEGEEKTKLLVAKLSKGCFICAVGDGEHKGAITNAVYKVVEALGNVGY